MPTITYNITKKFWFSHLFRYYSTNSVCIPKIFARYDDPSWPLTITIMAINFLSFLYIVVAYCIIVCKSKTSQLKTGQVRKNNGKGIIRLFSFFNKAKWSRGDAKAFYRNHHRKDTFPPFWVSPERKKVWTY